MLAAMAADDKHNKVSAIFLCGYVNDNMAEVARVPIWALRADCPVQSSRLIQMRGPPRCRESRSMGSKGVLRCAKRRRGKRERCMTTPVRNSE